MITTIEITKEDIENGHRHSCTRCPLANALSRLYSTNRINIGFLSGSVNGLMFKTTDSSKRFICNFDDGWFINPLGETVTIEFLR